MIKFRRGDTIIEVLMAMAIIGLILAAAYATSSRNLKTSRLTQERTEAVKIAESQIESMKALSGDARNNLYTQSGQFAIVSNAIQAGTWQTMGYYEVSIDRSGSEVFLVNVRWTPPGGSDTNKSEVKLTYRYPRQ